MHWKRNRGNLIRSVNLPFCVKGFPIRSRFRLTMRVFGLQLLAEEKAISEKNAMERDNAERDARQNETKVSTEISAIWFLLTICKVGGNSAISASGVQK